MESTIIYLAAFCALLAVAIGTAVLVVRRDGRGLEAIVKQWIIWVGIAALLPLTSWAGATLLHPRTTMKDLTEQRSRLQQEQQQESYGSNNNNDRNAEERKAAAAEARERYKKYADESQRLRKLIDEEQRLFYRAMFLVGFPTGLVALVAGLLLRPVAVGTGLAFGGLCTLVVGCYSYWDGMGDAMRFGSLFVVLAALITIGLMKFGHRASTTAHTDTSRAA